MNPAISFVNDFDRFYHFELQKIRKEAPEGQGTQPGPLAQVRTPKGKPYWGNSVVKIKNCARVPVEHRSNHCIYKLK